MPTGTDMLVIRDLAVLGLDVTVGPVVADLKYLTGKEVRSTLYRKFNKLFFMASAFVSTHTNLSFLAC